MEDLRQKMREQGTQAVPLLVEHIALADETMKSWKGSLDEWLSLKKDNDTLYFIISDEGPVAIFWGNEQLHATEAFYKWAGHLEGYTSVANSKVTAQFTYEGTSSISSKDILSNDSGHFEYIFEKPLTYLSFSNNSALSKPKTFTKFPFIGSKVTDMNNMFYNCMVLTSLDLSSFNTENVTNMNRMFCYCSALTSIDLSTFNTEKVTTMMSMFSGCTVLETLNISSFNTENVTSMQSMFNDCRALKAINLGLFNMKNAATITDMFTKCSTLTNITGTISNIKADISLKDSSLLTPESCMVFINSLSEEVSGKKITFHADAYDRLTPEQIAIATSKGWSVVRA